MKHAKILVLALALALLTACAAPKEAALPAHKTMVVKASADAQESSMYNAYLRAIDTAINLVIDEKLNQKPEYISFDWGTNFALGTAQREKLAKAFGVYGDIVDTRGLNPPLRSIEEMGKGVTVLFPTGAQHATEGADLTITVEVIHSKTGYAYYFDYVISGGKYILTEYSSAYINPR